MSQRENKAPINRGQEDILYLQSNLPNIAMGEGVQGGQFGGMAKESTGWDVYNNEAKKVDTELVNDWRDSLNSLLLFAAIFAAVLTAFITESKKMLEQDPTEVLVDIMVFVTNNLANGTHTPYSRPEFLPNSIAVIVNSLFFASLSASLIAALASVVALQWVADYDAAITRGGSSPEDRAKRRQFRYAGVVTWNMSEIIAALPLLLYCSVIIFFAGLMIWMWNLNHIVGLVVIAGASIAILFYGISTFLSVIFVSAPFRTPLSRWMYSSTQFLLILVHRLSLLLHIPFTQTWFGSQSPMATAPRRREDFEVECRNELKVDALVWLANQLSLSQDSYERFLLLASELPKLENKDFLSPTFWEAPWLLILDLLGWKSFGINYERDVDPRDLQAMEVLTQCYRIPDIFTIVFPKDSLTYLSDNSKEEYWYQFCQAPPGQWSANSQQRIPNFLFLLLRDIPLPSESTRAQLELTIHLSRWRNSGAGGLIIESATSRTSDVSGITSDTSLVVVDSVLKITDWSSQDDDDRFKVILRRMMQVLMKDGESLSPEFLDLLRWRFEALVMEDYPGIDSTSCLSTPYQFCRSLAAQTGRDDKTNYMLLHQGFTVLLARNLSSFFGEELTRRIKEIITMLWILGWGRIWGNIPTERRGMENFFEENQQSVKRWITSLSPNDRIYEILHFLALAQVEAPNFFSLWRVTASGRRADPLLVEVSRRIDWLIGKGMIPPNHLTLINLVCQDIELGPPEDFIGYFTEARLEYLQAIEDPCLQLVVKAVGGSALESLPLPFIDVSSPLKESYTRIARYVFKLQENADALHTLPLCASLWDFAHEQADQLSTRALAEMNILMRLEKIFQCDVLCPLHFNGDGHILLHVFDKLRRCKPFKSMEAFTTISKDAMVLDAPLMILLLPEEHNEVSLTPEGLGPTTGPIDPHCLSYLINLCKRVKEDQFMLLSLLADLTSRVASNFALAAEDVEAISFCINMALRLPQDHRSVTIIPTVMTRLLECRDIMMDHVVRTKEENLVASKKAEATADALKTRLARSLVFGRRNRQLLSCARTYREGSPASGWLSMYMD